MSHSLRDDVFPTFVGILTFSDVPISPPPFFSFPPPPRACIVHVCVTTMRVNWWLSGQFWLRKSSSLDPHWGAAPGPRWGLCPPNPRSHDTFLLFWTVLVASLLTFAKMSLHGSLIQDSFTSRCDYGIFKLKISIWPFWCFCLNFFFFLLNVSMGIFTNAILHWLFALLQHCSKCFLCFCFYYFFNKSTIIPWMHMTDFIDDDLHAREVLWLWNTVNSA